MQLRGLARGLLLLCVLGSAACTTVTVTPESVATPAQTYHTVIVGKSDNPDAKLAPLDDIFRAGFIRRLGELKAFDNVIDASATSPVPSDALLVSGIVTEADKGDVVLRGLIGMGAGREHVTARLDLKSSDGKPLGQLEIRKAYSGGAGIGGFASFVDLDDLTKQVGEQAAQTLLDWSGEGDRRQLTRRIAGPAFVGPQASELAPVGEVVDDRQGSDRPRGVMTEISEATLRQQLADCHRMMVMADLMDYSGHVSARLPGRDRILILPRDASRAGVTAADMLVVGLDGKVLDGKGPAPTETEIHLSVYRARPDVQAVGHGHPPLSTLFTMVESPVIAMRNFGFRFIGMPVHPDPTHIRTPEQGAAVAKTLGRGRYCLLRGHGSVVAVNSVPEVFLDSLEMESNAGSVLQAASLGRLKPITPDEAELLRASFARNDYRVAKTWEHYREKARRAGLL